MEKVGLLFCVYNKTLGVFSHMYYASAKEMEKLDEIAVEHGLQIHQMMELAGWHMLTLFDTLQIKRNKKIVVVCGKGNKGGDGLCATRHLINHGWDVSVLLVSKDIKSDPAYHLRLLEKMGVEIVMFNENEDRAQCLIDKSDIIIDALIGYHLDGNPYGASARLIESVNKAGKIVVAYDIPSGIDATSGACLEPCVHANATLVLALLKKCFNTKTGLKRSGKIFLGDIGIPEFLYNEIEVGSRPSFEGGIVQV